MAEAKIVFRKSSGSKKKDKEVLEVSEENISLQNRRESALIISFKAPENKVEEINQFFDSFDELEPILVDIADAGDVEYYFRGISPLKELNEEGESLKHFSVTLQLRREFL
jgi:hypothetical protein